MMLTVLFPVIKSLSCFTLPFKILWGFYFFWAWSTLWDWSFDIVIILFQEVGFNVVLISSVWCFVDCSMKVCSILLGKWCSADFVLIFEGSLYSSIGYLPISITPVMWNFYGSPSLPSWLSWLERIHFLGIRLPIVSKLILGMRRLILYY